MSNRVKRRPKGRARPRDVMAALRTTAIEATFEAMLAQRQAQADPSDENVAKAHEATTRAYALAGALEIAKQRRAGKPMRDD